MAAITYGITIHCLGNKSDIRAMWIAVSRPFPLKDWQRFTELRWFDFTRLEPIVSIEELGEFTLPLTDAQCEIGADKNSIYGENMNMYDTEPENLYAALAAAFPWINFYFTCESEVENGSGEREKSAAVYENGKPARDRSLAAWRKDHQNDDYRETHDIVYLDEWKEEIAGLNFEADREAIKIWAATIPASLKFLHWDHDDAAQREIFIDICAEALLADFLAIDFIDGEETKRAAIKRAVERDKLFFTRLGNKYKDADLCAFAVALYPKLLRDVPKEFVAAESDAELLAIVEKDFRALQGFPAEKQSFAVCMAALKQNPFRAFRMIKNQTPEICLEAVKLDAYNILPLVKNQTEEIIKAALAQNPDAAIFVTAKGV